MVLQSLTQRRKLLALRERVDAQEAILCGHTHREGLNVLYFPFPEASPSLSPLCCINPTTRELPVLPFRNILIKLKRYYVCIFIPRTFINPLN